MLTRASYNQTCSDTKPVAPRLRETGTPHIPAQRSRRSLWNTALLDIEQISSYYKNNNYTGVMLQWSHQHGDTTPAILHLLYASSGTCRSSGKLLAAEQRRRWWTPLRGTLARTQSSSHARQPRQAIKQSWHHLQSGMTRQVSTLNVLASSQQP